MSRFPFTPYPNGWFVVAFSEDLPRGGVLTRHYFGQDIVLYRTEAGVAYATKPHCPHMGAHLGHGGQVVGETLRCPFHGWCFDGEGKCTSVPGMAKPMKVSLSGWHLREVNGLIFIYHHADGAAPEWEVPVLDEDQWSSNDTKVMWNLRTHPQEVFENTVDTTHLAVLHGMRKAFFVREPSEDGLIFRMRLGYEAPGEEPDTGIASELEIAMHGLGCTIIVAEMVANGFLARQRIHPTPIDGERIDLRAIVNVQRLPDAEMTGQIAQGFLRSFMTALEEDFPVLENKLYVERPPFAPKEQFINVYRNWAQRFYGN